MRTTVTLDSDRVNQLMAMTHAKSKAQAVVLAIEEYFRMRRVNKILSLEGQLEFTMSAEELRRDRF